MENIMKVMKKIFIISLWTLFSMPIVLGLHNAYYAVNPPEEIIEPIPMETEIIEQIEETSEFIWEDEPTFARAFRTARMLLGPDNTFKWQGNLYHTNYKEEFVSLDY